MHQSERGLHLTRLLAVAGSLFYFAGEFFTASQMLCIEEQLLRRYFRLIDASGDEHVRKKEILVKHKKALLEAGCFQVIYL